MLRALLAMRMDYVKRDSDRRHHWSGHGVIVRVGRSCSATPRCLFIAFFIWIGASQEAGMTQMKNAISGIPVGRAMLTDYKSLSPRDPLSHMSQLILAGSQHDFPVIENDRVVGVVTRDDFLAALTQHGQNIAISSVMRRTCPQWTLYEMVENALMRIQESGIPALPVTHSGQLVGIVTAENITEYLMIRSALKASGRWFRYNVIASYEPLLERDLRAE